MTTTPTLPRRRPAPHTVDAALIQLDELGYKHCTSHRYQHEGSEWLAAGYDISRGGVRSEAKGATPLAAFAALVAEARRHQVQHPDAIGPTINGEPIYGMAQW